jgi:transposase-like protein
VRRKHGVLPRQVPARQRHQRGQPHKQLERFRGTIRRSVQARGHFPSEESAVKLICLRLRVVIKDWKMPACE